MAVVEFTFLPSLFIIKKTIMIKKTSTSVAERLSLWALDRAVLGSISGWTNLRNELYIIYNIDTKI